MDFQPKNGVETFQNYILFFDTIYEPDRCTGGITNHQYSKYVLKHFTMGWQLLWTSGLELKKSFQG